jgi:hypothetical protein
VSSAPWMVAVAAPRCRAVGAGELAARWRSLLLER